MLMLFRRKVLADNQVHTTLTAVIDGQHHEIGSVHFPDKSSWTKFWGAVQKGALSIRELEVSMENDARAEAEIKKLGVFTPTKG